MNILSLTYLMIGTFVFLYLEKDNELQTRREKFHQVQNIYRLIVNEAVSICRSEQYNSPTTVSAHFLTSMAAERLIIWILKLCTFENLELLQ